MEIHHLRCFDAVATELHFGRAAERLHLSPSPVSRAVKELERELGADLFVRRYHQVELTAVGAALAPRVRTILDELADIASIARSEDVARARVVRVGGTYLAPPTAMDEFIDLVRGVAGEREVTVVSRPSADLLPLLQQGELDLAMVHLPVDHRGVATLETAQYAFAVAMRAGDPLADRAVVALEDLRDRTLAVGPPTPQPEAMERLLDTLRRAVGALVQVPDTDSAQLASHVRRTGDLTLTLDPATGGAARVFDDPAFAVRPLADGILHFSLGLAWRAAATEGDPLLDAFVAEARGRWEGRPRTY